MKKGASVTKLVKLVGKGHSQCLSESILECYGKECYSNVEFICKQQNNSKRTLSANKAVLAASSKKLAHLLSETTNEDMTTIMIPDRDFITVKSLLQYIYSGKVLVNSQREELETLISEWDIAPPEITVCKAAAPTRSYPAQQVAGPSSFQTSTGSKNKLPPASSISSPSNKKQKVSETQADELSVPPPVEAVIDLATDDGINNVAPTPKKSPKPKSKRTTDQEGSSGYVFLATYIKSTKSKLQSDASPPKKTIVPAEKPPIPVEVTSTTDNGGQQVAKTTKKKVSKPATSNRPSLDLNISIELAGDEAPGREEVSQMELEQDREEFNLARTFLDEEKMRHEELTSSLEELKDMVERHKDYARHFLGTDGAQAESVRIPCLTCGKLVHRDYMPTHISIHSNERPYLCDQCGATFVLPDRLRKHIKYTHADETQIKLHVCTVCEKPFKKASYLQRHMTLHQGVKPYSCPYCDKSFRLPNVLLKHKRTHTGERPYECPTCHRRFSARTNFVIHCRRHKKNQLATGATPFVDPSTQMLKCDICGASFHREFAFLTHVAAHKGEDPKLPCRHCPETFRTYKLLREHAKEMHADSMFQCDQCPRMFFNKATLTSHLATHAGTEGEFTCEECERRFHTKVQLTNHQKSAHSDERPFICSFCGKNLKSKITLIQHERIHTGERPYVCPHCPKAFRQDVHLANHIRLHTGEKPFVCQYCDKAFNNKNNLGIHIKIHTGQKNQCGVCGQVFRSIVKLRLHESTHTPPEDPLGGEEETCVSAPGAEEDE